MVTEGVVAMVAIDSEDIKLSSRHLYLKDAPVFT